MIMKLKSQFQYVRKKTLFNSNKFLFTGNSGKSIVIFLGFHPLFQNWKKGFGSSGTIPPFIYSFKKCLFSTYYVTGSVSGSGL